MTSYVTFLFSSIYRVIKAIYALYMHVHTNDAVFSKCNSIANNKNLPPIICRDHPWTRFVLLDSSAEPVAPRA